MPAGEIAEPKTMLLSEKGRQFIFRHEAGDGHATAHLHHPAGHSGVTLGPGYDMKERRPDEIATDLRRIGVDAETAAAAAKGAGLHDGAADEFVRENRSLLNLTMGQQVQLQIVYKGHYEQMVRNASSFRCTNMNSMRWFRSPAIRAPGTSGARRRGW